MVIFLMNIDRKVTMFLENTTGLSILWTTFIKVQEMGHTWGCTHMTDFVEI